MAQFSIICLILISLKSRFAMTSLVPHFSPIIYIDYRYVTSDVLFTCEVTSPLECFVKCYENGGCASVNFSWRNRALREGTCSLLKDEVSRNSEMEEASGWSYISKFTVLNYFTIKVRSIEVLKNLFDVSQLGGNHSYFFYFFTF